MGSDYSKNDFRRAKNYVDSNPINHRFIDQINDAQFKIYVRRFVSNRSELQTQQRSAQVLHRENLNFQQKIESCVKQCKKFQQEADMWAKCLWNCVKSFDESKVGTPTSEFQQLILERFKSLKAEIKTRDKLIQKLIRTVTGDEKYKLDYKQMPRLALQLRAEVQKGRRQASIIMRDVFVYDEKKGKDQYKQALEQKERELEQKERELQEAKQELEDCRKLMQQTMNESFDSPISSRNFGQFSTDIEFPKTKEEEQQNLQTKDFSITSLTGEKENSQRIQQELDLSQGRESFCKSIIKDQSEIRFLQDRLKKQGQSPPQRKLVYRLNSDQKENYLEFIKQKDNILFMFKTDSAQSIAIYIQKRLDQIKLLSLTRQEQFKLIPNRRSIHYNENEIILGDNEFRASFHDRKMSTRFGECTSFFLEERNAKQILKAEKVNVVNIQEFEVFEVCFEK